MQISIRKIANNACFFPFIIFIICVWRIFLPQLPANHGLGWDGYNYYLIVVDGLQSNVLDSYLALRIFPSLLVHVLFKLFGIAFTPGNVILAFKIMNTVLITCNVFMVKKIFEQYELNSISQLVGFAIVFLNYAVLNFTFYYPVMTDTPAFFLSVALFYFFVRGELLNVFLVGLIGAFTFPVLFAMAAALILFPKTNNEFMPAKNSASILLSISSAVYVLSMGWYLIFLRGEKADLPFTLPLSYGMLPVSFFTIGLLYFFMPQILCNKIFFQLNYYRLQLNGNRIFAVIVLVIIFITVRFSFSTNGSSEYLSFYHQIKTHLLYAFQRPVITVVSHFNYYGCAMLLLILFWKKFSAFVSTFGLGIAGSIFFCLFIFSMKPESRVLIFFFPWLMILVSLYLGRFQFGKIFYALIFLINFITAKLWLFFSFHEYTDSFLPDGTIDFPDQWFFMHLGLWETERVWLWLCLAVAVSLLLFIFSLYKIEFGKKEILFYKKFEALNL